MHYQHSQINIVFLVFVLKSLWKNKKSAAKRMGMEESNFELVKLSNNAILLHVLAHEYIAGLYCRA